MSLNVNLRRIVAIDPGVTTGVVMHEVIEGEVNPKFTRREFGPDEHHLQLFDWLKDLRPDVIVFERFEYRIVRNRGTDMPGIRLESREYIGVLRLYLQMHPNVEAAPQTVASAKNLYTDDKLKRLGLYRAPLGRQHMNDATRHALYYITVTMRRRDYLARLSPIFD